MAVVRIDDELHEQIRKWIEKKGNKYRFPSLSAFANKAIYDKLEQLKK